MNTNKVTVEFKDMGNYRVTYHKGSELIEIEEYAYKDIMFVGRRGYWKRIYIGFASRLETSLTLYNEAKKNHNL